MKTLFVLMAGDEPDFPLAVYDDEEAATAEAKRMVDTYRDTLGPFSLWHRNAAELRSQLIVNSGGRVVSPDEIKVETNKRFGEPPKIAGRQWAYVVACDDKTSSSDSS